MYQEKPNILVITTDQQHAKMLSCAGNDYVSTPALDSLAASGVRFNRTYCTDPVCIPSRFSLMTGRMPLEIGLRGNYPEQVKEVPASIKETGAGWLLKEEGYDAVYGGKEHLPKINAEDLGFNYLTDNERDKLPRVCSDYLHQDRDRPFFMVASFINPHDICHMAIRDFAQTDFDFAILKNCQKEQEVLDKALQIPEGIDEKKFFADYCPPLPENFEPQKQEPEAVKRLLDLRPFRRDARRKYTEKDWRRHRWAYSRLTERVDYQIGKLLDAVRDSGHWDDTVIIFTSDHGDMDSSHRLEHKTVFYEEAANIPLIVSDPQNTRKGLSVNHLVSNGLDLLPTIFDYAGVKPPQELSGLSFRDTASGRIKGQKRDYIPVQNEIGFMIVTERYKYQLYDKGENREQLFDLQKDPWEMENFAEDPDYGKVLQKHRQFFQQEWPNKLAGK